MQGKPDLLHNTDTLIAYRDNVAELRARLATYEAALREILKCLEDSEPGQIPEYMAAIRRARKALEDK